MLNTTDQEVLNTKINNAFASMRKHGLVARQRFSCCTSCAYAQIRSEIKEGKLKRKTGICFYTKQDAADGPRTSGKHTHSRYEPKLYLAYSSIDDQDTNTLEVADVVTKCLTEAGLTWEWNGKIDQKIMIKLS